MKTGRDQLIQPVQVHIKPRHKLGICEFAVGCMPDLWYNNASAIEKMRICV